MGIALVLILYAVALTIAACVGAAVFGATTHSLTRSAHSGRKRAVIASVIFPFTCVGFAGLWFVVYAIVNDVVFDRDPGLGDSWNTPLPNGYALNMIDTTDQGTVYNPKTQSGDGSIASKDDAVFGVRQLQVSKGLIFGARDSGYFGRMGQDSKAVDTYFELNTNKQTHSEYKTLFELRQQAASEGVSLKLREFASVFGDYRTTWFDYVAGAVLLLVPMLGLALLAFFIWRIRQQVTPLALPV
jgi:hypothetical protein